MSVATLATEMTDRLGEARLIELTSWDVQDGTTPAVNTTRRNRALTDACARIRRRAGLTEPTDTTTDAYASYVELVVLGFEFYLLWYKSRTSAETKDAADAFHAECKEQRDVGSVTPVTDSPVDVSNQDTTSRRARFAPSHFTDYRIGSAVADPDLDET